MLHESPKFTANTLNSINYPNEQSFFIREDQPKNSGKKAFELAATLSSSFVHELRTPLAVISIYTDLLGNSYKKILSDNFDKDSCVISDYVSIMKKTIEGTNDLISSLLAQVKELVAGTANNGERFVNCSISSSVNEVLEQYPFRESERDLVRVIGAEDFEYRGDHILTNHVLSNLIKNSLRAINAEGKGNITIELKTSEDFNSLIFTDTASGIPKKMLTKIFDIFESSKSMESNGGVGLPFCAMVMDFYGGTIDCLSEFKTYTKFILKFPKIKYYVSA